MDWNPKLLVDNCTTFDCVYFISFQFFSKKDAFKIEIHEMILVKNVFVQLWQILCAQKAYFELLELLLDLSWH